MPKFLVNIFFFFFHYSVKCLYLTKYPINHIINKFYIIKKIQIFKIVVKTLILFKYNTMNYA